jgi:hypothetical protein
MYRLFSDPNVSTNLLYSNPKDLSLGSGIISSICGDFLIGGNFRFGGGSGGGPLGSIKIRIVGIGLSRFSSNCGDCIISFVSCGADFGENIFRLAGIGFGQISSINGNCFS